MENSGKEAKVIVVISDGGVIQSFDLQRDVADTSLRADTLATCPNLSTDTENIVGCLT